MTDTTLDMAALLEAHAAGDRTAFERIWQHYRDDLWAFLCNHVGRRADAEDLFQNIGIKVFRHLGSVRDTASVRSWLFAIALNAVRSYYRRRKAWQLEERDEAPPTDREGSAPSPEEHVVQRERLALMQACLQKLPERDREVLLLGTMAELPGQVIAERLELNLNTVKTILRRTKIKLARLMVEAEHGE